MTETPDSPLSDYAGAGIPLNESGLLSPLINAFLLQAAFMPRKYGR